jgi:hypothetical protein
MKRSISLFLSLLVVLLSALSLPALAEDTQKTDTVKVKGYTKKDGTKVEGYERKSTKKNADSDTQQVSGYTKKDGTKVSGYTRKKSTKTSK